MTNAESYTSGCESEFHGSSFVSGKAAAREVRIKSTRDNGYLVEGLNGGEEVITAGPAELRDGDRIKIKGAS